MSSASKTIERESSIELLKILAMVMIVMSHVVQTVGNKSIYVGNMSYALDLSCATHNIQSFYLSLIRYFGAFGDWIFFVCSA